MLKDRCFMCGGEADMTIDLDGNVKPSCEPCSKIILKAVHGGGKGTEALWNCIERRLTLRRKRGSV